MTQAAPSSADRDRLFKTFGRAWFKRDVALLYEAVSPDFEWRWADGTGSVKRVASREGVAEAFAAAAGGPNKTRFEDVVYHHAPEATFMTFRIIETGPSGEKVRDELGIERYTFKDGRIAVKDVYKKPA